MTDRRMTADAFFTGIFATLARRGQRALSIECDSFDRMMEAAYKRLEELGPRYNVKPDFLIRAHPFHGNSLTVRESISRGALRSLISLDNPEFQHVQIKIDNAAAEQLLSKYDLDAELFNALADEIAPEKAIAGAA